MQTKNTLYNKAFSLVELSIVLVILGLLVGGIMTGQNLIRASQLRSISTQLDSYRTAVYIFKDKYFALPGDMPNAVKFWTPAAGGTDDGVDAACAALDHTSPSTGTETCNGNGDGSVEASYEMMRFWQHLANAGLIGGQYTGVSANSSTDRAHVPGLNCPASKYPSGGFSFYDIPDASAGHSWLFEGTYGHSFYIGTPSTNHATAGSLLLAEEAWNVDTKLDDGKPGQGNMRSRIQSHHAGCATSDDPATAEFDLDATTKSCMLYFISGL